MLYICVTYLCVAKECESLLLVSGVTPPFAAVTEGKVSCKC